MSRNAVAVAWALHARGLTPTAWKILMVMAHKINNRRGDWDTWPSQKRLAHDAELTLSTLKRHLIELETKGFISRTQRYREDGALSSCTYTLRVKATFEMPENDEHHDFSADDTDGYSDAPPIGQSDLGAKVRGELGARVNGDLCKEPLNIEPLKNEDSPIIPKGDDTDLFGLPVVDHDMTDEQLGDAYVERWNRLCDAEEKLERVTRFSADRQKELALRLDTRKPAEVGVLLDELFKRIAASRWLRGRDRKSAGWRASWSWVLKKMNFNKIMDGTYVQDFDSENPDASGSSGERSHIQAGRDAAGAIDAMYRERFGGPGSGA